MNSIHKQLLSQSGSTALVAITAVMLLGLMGSGLLFYSTTELNMATNYRDGIGALYLAEAGAKRALVELSNNSAWKPANPYFEGSGSYSIQITLGTPSTIEATGTVNQATRKIVLKATIPQGPESPPHSIAIHSWNYH